MAFTEEQLHELRRDILTRLAPVLDAFIVDHELDDALASEVAIWGLLEAAAITAYTSLGDADPLAFQKNVGEWTSATFQTLIAAAARFEKPAAPQVH